MEPTRRLVIIGNSIAASCLLDELVDAGSSDFEITVIGQENMLAYNRVMLPVVLSGEKTLEQISLHDAQWYSDNNIQCVLAQTITAVDRDRQVVIDTHGGETPYDQLVFATGAATRDIPITGHTLPGVMAFRDMADVDTLRSIATNGCKVVVLGGGLLGLEAAASMSGNGAEVTLVHRNTHIMNRQLDAQAGQLLQSELESRGITIKLGHAPEAVLGEDCVEAVQLANGERIAADVVIQAAGISPRYSLAKDAGLDCRHAILVNDQMRTSDDKVFALGECCEHDGTTIGLVAPIRQHAAVLAQVLLGETQAAYAPSATATQLKVSGVQLFSAGDIHADENTEELEFFAPALSDQLPSSYRKIFINNNCIRGVVMYGDTSDSNWYFDLLQAGTDVSAIREQLLFGQAFCA